MGKSHSSYTGQLKLMCNTRLSSSLCFTDGKGQCAIGASTLPGIIPRGFELAGSPSTGAGIMVGGWAEARGHSTGTLYS